MRARRGPRGCGRCGTAAGRLPLGAVATDGIHAMHQIICAFKRRVSDDEGGGVPSGQSAFEAAG
jgi:hypothetical protein